MECEQRAHRTNKNKMRLRVSPEETRPKIGSIVFRLANIIENIYISLKGFIHTISNLVGCV